MVKCFALNGVLKSDGDLFDDFTVIYHTLNENRSYISDFPVEAIVLILDEYGRRLTSKRELLSMEGTPFLSLWLKKDNIYKTLKVNFEKVEFLDEFVEIEEEKYMAARPRGIVSHWIAGNVPTLALYSMFMAVLSKNCSLVRVPRDSIQTVIELLRNFDGIDVEYDGKVYKSQEILKTISVVYFESSNGELNEKMSLLADARVVWGGQEAVDSINMLSKKTTCKDLIFGPKYSFAVFEKSVIESSEFSKFAEALAGDVFTFNQTACSSPQVLFLEKSSLSLEQCGKVIGEAFKKLNKRNPKKSIGESEAAKIINARGEYGLDLDKTFLCSSSLDWTLLMDNAFKLEEPIQGRTLFIKEVDDLTRLKDLITNKIQTVGIASLSLEKSMKLARILTLQGAYRVVKVGYMNFYDSPWDGSLMISELVRWCTLNVKGMINNKLK